MPLVPSETKEEQNVGKALLNNCLKYQRMQIRQVENERNLSDCISLRRKRINLKKNEPNFLSCPHS